MPSVTMRTWCVANHTAACYPVGVPAVLHAQISEYSNILSHNQQQIHNKQHHGVVKQHHATPPLTLPPSMSSHCCQQYLCVSVRSRLRSSVSLRAPISLYCIEISCNAIDDIMAPTGKLLLVLFAKTNPSFTPCFPLL